MKKIIILFFVFLIIAVINLSTKTKNKEEINIEPLKAVEEIPVLISPEDFLEKEAADSGLSDRDFIILREIIFCESSWQHYYKDGSVKISNGNVGLAQINIGAHKKEYEALGLDIYNPYDNLRYAIILYKRNGIKDWDKWSGHCFRPRLEKEGIFLNVKNLEGQIGGQCVEFVEDLFKNWLAIGGRADEIIPNSDNPKAGGTVLTEEGASGHIAYIYEIKEGKIILLESNYYNDGKITFGRELEIDSQKIRGYYNFNQ